MRNPEETHQPDPEEIEDPRVKFTNDIAACHTKEEIAALLEPYATIKGRTQDIPTTPMIELLKEVPLDAVLNQAEWNAFFSRFTREYGLRQKIQDLYIAAQSKKQSVE